jgi:hypothetical protein
MKRSFIMYHDQYLIVKDLDDQTFSILMRAVFEYAEHGTMPDFKGLMLSTFMSFKITIDRDIKKYESICERNRENGKAGGRPKKPSGFSGNPKKPKKADSDSVSENESDTSIISQPDGCSPNEQERKRSNQSQNAVGSRREKPEIPADFIRCWEAYGKKGTRAIALRYWKKLSAKDRQAIEEAIPAYVEANPEKIYRKDFNGWINPSNRMWENEVVPREEKKEEDKVWL